jgi:hypothetical protein
MSKISSKKLSAAVAVAVLGLGVATRAATVISTGFEASGEAYGNYTAGSSLVGQPVSGTPTNTWSQDPNATSGSTLVTSGASTAQSGSQAVALTSTAGGYTDFYNSLTALPNQGTSSNGIVTISFGLERATPTGGQTTGYQPQGGTGPAENGFGVDVLDSSDNVIANLYVRNTAVTGTNPASVPALFTNSSTSGTPDSEIYGPAGSAAADGSYGTYTMTLNFGLQSFTVTNGSTTSGPYPFAESYDGNTLEGIALGSDGEGTDTAYFDNFSVAGSVPEPMSVSMIGLGSLVLMGRRRRQTQTA